MKTKFIALGFSVFLISGTAIADDDCEGSVSDRQSRENLRQQLEADGWEVYRIKVDDGCYEVKGKNEWGNLVEAEFEPSTFELMELEREDEDEEDDDEERDNDKASGNNNCQRPMPSNGIVKDRPSVTVE
jgi:hypothetical protein